MAGRSREVVGGGDEGRMRERGSVEDTEGNLCILMCLHTCMNLGIFME